jgi:hypothetical protein
MNNKIFLTVAAIVASAMVFSGCSVNAGKNHRNQADHRDHNKHRMGGAGAAGLQDLVGTKGGSGEMALRNRGYTHVKGSNGGAGSYASWRNGKHCVWVRTVNGHYASIADAPMEDCR